MKTKNINKSFAFTLAEVLITLGIIGVVAALTIPGLIANTQQKTKSVRLKKFYSTMKQAIMLAQDAHGDVNTWDTSLPYDKFFDTYFIPYLTGSKNASGNTIYFSDGSRLTIWKGNCMDLTYDTNGQSNPNREGYDIFRFLICDSDSHYWCANEGFCTYRTSVTDKTNRNELLRLCKQSPPYCSALLEHDNWEFKSDYPYK